ncbi:hypothetical protein K1T71_009954 [Dendrolimus kikuchii]|uniref:Uncharacterized protein n=1 Tax=Dendrolimus kikuchii TaxID=765133 RepID=A0ACC1CTH3_9NEOP|nr:hypothetical protein K1T71_009954 [Dendrolimus kikuchii]
MRWNENVTLQFVKLYLKHECLWNPSHPGYKLKYERIKAYDIMVKDFQACTTKKLSIPEVKMKIKNLRTTYMQQLNKILEKSSPDSIYEPSLIWFHEMDQCLKHVPNNRTPVYVCSQEPVVDSTEMWENDIQIENVGSINPDPLTPQLDEEFETRQESKVKPECSLSPVHFKKKIKKKKVKHVRKSSMDSNSDTGREDEFDIYGKFIAAQLRGMELQQALRIQLEIQHLIKVTCKFVKLYLRHECLWNRHHDDYRIKSAKSLASKEVIKEFKNSTGITLTEPELNIKLKSLRSTYTQEVAKIKARSTPDWTYKPSLKWFSDWDRCLRKEKLTVMSILEDENNTTVSKDSRERVWLSPNSTRDNAPTPDPFDNDYNKIILKLEPEDNTPMKGQNRKLSKKRKIKLRSPSTESSFNTVRGSHDSRMDSTEDEFDIYGKYIASQLRQMNLQKALRVQVAIQNLVSEARISDIEANNN